MSGRGFDQDEFAEAFLAEAAEIIAKLDVASIENAAALLASTRAGGGRLFILGVGGSAANASHAVNDFRKIAGIEAYAPTDNVSELTARANDEGWASIFDGWLRTSRLRPEDLLLILSVGGGNVEQNVSPNLVAALKYAKSVGTKIIGIVGRDGGYTAAVADACVLIPTVNTCARHAAHRSVSGSDLASCSFRIRAKDAGYEMGIDGTIAGPAKTAPCSSTATA
jgi:D-sedoheptulose 7-phosphate isomerase